MSPAAEPEKAHVAAEFAAKAPLIACRFEPKGRYLFATAEDDSVLRWDLSAPEPAKAAPTLFNAHSSWVFALAGLPDGGTFLTGGGDGRLIWWPTAAEKPEPIRDKKAHAGWVRSIAVSPDGRTVATCGNDRMVRLWSSEDGGLLMELPGHDRPVYRVMFTPDGRTLLSADLLGRVIVWDHRPGKEGRRLDAGKLYKYEGGQGVDYGGVRDFALSPDGKYLACAGLIEASNPLGAVSNPAIVVLDWASGKELKLIRPKEDIKGVMWGVRFLPSGDLVGASGGTGGGSLWFFKPEGPNEFHRLSMPNTARDMDLHPDGLRIATAHHDKKTRVILLRPKTN